VYPNGTGYSETCNSSSERICDTPYTLASGNIDYLPLAKEMNYSVHNLNSGVNYTRIQGALDAASSGDTIEVTAGNYSENLDITTAVNLVGAGKDLTILNVSDSSDHVINVSGANSVNISGFTVTGTGITSGKAGILLENSDYSKIEYVYSLDNQVGINLSNSDNCTIANNTIYVGVEDTDTSYNVYGLWAYNSEDNNIENNSVKVREYLGWGLNPTYYHGFYLYYSDTNTLTYNNVSKATNGFTLVESDRNILSNNTASKIVGSILHECGFNLTLSDYNILNNNTAFLWPSGISCSDADYYGTFIEDGSNNTVSEGTFYDTAYGIRIYHKQLNQFYPKNNSILGNDVFDTCDGINLYAGYEFNSNTTIANNSVYSITNNAIELYNVNNTISSNGYGLYISNAYNITITKNRVQNNSHSGIQFSSSSSNNTIYDNYFNNTKNVGFDSGTYANNFNTPKTALANIVGGSYLGGNYWAYPNGTGYSQSCDDADYDGICDSIHTLASGNIDYLPLTEPPSLEITIVSPANATYNTLSPTLNVTTTTSANVTYSLNGTTNVSLYTSDTQGNTTITTSLGQNNVTIYANDSFGNSEASTVHFTIDTAPPVSSLNSTNNTEVGLGTLFSFYWTDNSGLGGYIFSTNNTGPWVNDSFVPMTGTGNWSNVTKTLNSTAGLHIGWRVYANDTSDHWNVTPIQVITTTAPESTPPPPGGGGGGGGGGTAAKLAIASMERIEAGVPATFTFDETLSEFVIEIVLTAKETIRNSKLAIETLEKKPYSGMADPPGHAYRYVKITPTRIYDSKIERAEVRFRVEVSWLKENDIDPATVELGRNVREKWEELATEKTDSDDDYVYYTAETPGFSYFSISGEEGSGYEEEVPEVTVEVEEVPEEVAPTPAPEESEEEGPGMWAMVNPEMLEKALAEEEPAEEKGSGILKWTILGLFFIGAGGAGLLYRKSAITRKNPPE